MKSVAPMEIYQDLLSHYGEQHWWPAESAFEMMVGAILTQNTNWNNVEKALHNLREAGVLDADVLATCNRETLETWIRPAGFFRQKTKSLFKLCLFYHDHKGVKGMKRWPMKVLRHFLLDVHGIGPETADSILLYAIEKPVFVVDTYTKRIFHRLGILPERIHKYNDVQHFFHQRTSSVLSLYQQFHALIVIHAKEHCRKKARCDACPLLHCCQYEYENNNSEQKISN
ncbi:MAG: endonuclease III [Flavobacteriaceae bacterium]|nr:MAG: endonuclease III [Flavobacteriaceae bacterium]